MDLFPLFYTKLSNSHRQHNHSAFIDYLFSINVLPIHVFQNLFEMDEPAHGIIPFKILLDLFTHVIQLGILFGSDCFAELLYITAFICKYGVLSNNSMEFVGLSRRQTLPHSVDLSKQGFYVLAVSAVFVPFLQLRRAVYMVPIVLNNTTSHLIPQLNSAIILRFHHFSFPSLITLSFARMCRSAWALILCLQRRKRWRWKRSCMLSVMKNAAISVSFSPALWYTVVEAITCKHH